jgi:hypothetical protein
MPYSSINDKQRRGRLRHAESGSLQSGDRTKDALILAMKGRDRRFFAK